MGNLKFNLDFVISWKVIGKLSEGKASHVPYRDSKLTRLLQSSLSGHGHVSVSSGFYTAFSIIIWFKYIFLSVLFCIVIIVFECGSLVRYGYSGFFLAFSPCNVRFFV